MLLLQFHTYMWIGIHSHFSKPNNTYVAFLILIGSDYLPIACTNIWFQYLDYFENKLKISLSFSAYDFTNTRNYFSTSQHTSLFWVKRIVTSIYRYVSINQSTLSFSSTEQITPCCISILVRVGVHNWEMSIASSKGNES